MYHAKKVSTTAMVPHKTHGADGMLHSETQGSNKLDDANVFGGSTTINAPNSAGSGRSRLRWTSDLHDRFVDAINQLGGPDSGYFCYWLIGCILPMVLWFRKFLFQSSPG